MKWPGLLVLLALSQRRGQRFSRTVHNEGATKGILVSTSGYGKASFDVANDKPLELLSGTNLIYLLKEHAQVDAKIEPPEHWADPAHDTGPAHWDDPPSSVS